MKKLISAIALCIAASAAPTLSFASDDTPVTDSPYDGCSRSVLVAKKEGCPDYDADSSWDTPKPADEKPYIPPSWYEENCSKSVLIARDPSCPEWGGWDLEDPDGPNGSGGKDKDKDKDLAGKDSDGDGIPDDGPTANANGEVPGVNPVLPIITALVGDEGSACEAILCLAASGVRPGACTPSLSMYFNIIKTTLTKTLTARKSFLSLCPIVSKDSAMASLVDALVDGAGFCDASGMNSNGIRGAGFSSDQLANFFDDDGMPKDLDMMLRYPANSASGSCEAYYSHPYSTHKPPVFIGIADKGGYWAPADKADAARAAYDAWYASKDWDKYTPPTKGDAN